MDNQISTERRYSSSESRELEKYIKFFTLKALQTIIQSRVGMKTKTCCNPSAKGLDWFNIALQDCEANNQLTTKIRELFGKRVPVLTQAVCVDIILKTVEGKYTILESWSMHTDFDKKEARMKNNFSFYNRFGLLLKSVITISRILPSYQLSRKVDHEFMLYFKVHSNIYQLHQYELHNMINIGAVSTPVGTIRVNVLYRNKIWLSGSMSAHTYNIANTNMLFPLSPGKDESRVPFQSVAMFENEIALASTDIGSTSTSNTLSPHGTSYKQTDYVDSGSKGGRSPDNLSQNHSIVGAFAEPSCIDLPCLELPDLSNSPPFLSLLKDLDSTAPEKLDQPPKQTDFLNKKRSSDEIPRQAEAVGFEDDFVLVELRPAFFSDDDSIGTLYKQCKYPTPLDMFASLEREDQEIESFNVDAEVEKYKSELEEYQAYFLDCG